jgi:hypothetical protein
VSDDAVATHDTVTQLAVAIGKVARVVPRAAEVIDRACTRDYSQPGKPSIDWDDPVAKQNLVPDLVNDALAVLSELGGEDAPQREDTAADALGLLALVAGQDVEPAQDSEGTDGRWQNRPQGQRRSCDLDGRSPRPGCPQVQVGPQGRLPRVMWPPSRRPV